MQRGCTNHVQYIVRMELYQPDIKQNVMHIDGDTNFRSQKFVLQFNEKKKKKGEGGISKKVIAFILMCPIQQ